MFNLLTLADNVFKGMAFFYFFSQFLDLPQISETLNGAD